VLHSIFSITISIAILNCLNPGIGIAVGIDLYPAAGEMKATPDMPNTHLNGAVHPYTIERAVD
jgi:hypothetical protein